MDMLFEQENLLMLMDERVTSDQWQWANLGLSRQISCETSIWDALLETTPIPAPISTKSDSANSTQNPMEDSNQDSHTTTHHSVNGQRPISTKGNDSNYEKNICAYITKKAVQCFIQSTYRRKVQKLCVKYGCDYNQAMEYYGKRYKEVFGITLLTLLISPQDESEVAMKEVFTVFLRWFLREKYMLYLMKNGKMSEKEKYVEFKNKYLLYISKSQEMLRI